ncbi:MFS transporter [Lentzea sp. BCCO 10_0061]|uniref:MFS transporter n=1 Tax=Lentzea sokolovensis TaxID=3095429 RepID=A0ABU4UQ59_9PSEU|nr:MFS transporter [Lentzea sp. BCCO 10_0061]MDX8141614.1 MFS transporter [Lentzea sp. BCCO 10_0061]
MKTSENNPAPDSAPSSFENGMSAPAVQEAQPLTGHPNRVLAVLLAACVSFALSQILVLPALPALARNYNASPTTTSWILTGFLLSASIATPIVGKLGERYGKARVLTAVLLTFCVGAVVNALAPSVGVLIAGRVLQGVAGGVFPLAFGVVRDSFPRPKVPGAISLISAIFGAGSGIALPLSGVIVDHLDVSWLFWLGLVSLPVAVAAHRWAPPSPRGDGDSIDWAGALLLAAVLASLLLGVTQAPSLGWGSPANVALLGGGSVLLLLWIRLESRITRPLIRLDVLAQRTVAMTNLTAFFIGVAIFAGFLLLPQLAQAPAGDGPGLGTTATAAGLLLLPSAIGQLLVGTFAGRLGVALGFRSTLVLGTALTSGSFAQLTAIHSSPWHLMLGGFTMGVGAAFAFGSMANLIVQSVQGNEVGVATGINTVVRTVGGAFGSAIATTVLAAHTGSTSTASGDGYTAGFVVATVAAVSAILSALLVPIRHGR